MSTQVSQEVACIVRQVIPCFADSMTYSVSPGGPGPSLVHLAGISEFPLWDFDEVCRAQESLFFRALRNPMIRIVRTRADLIADEKTNLLLGMRYPPDSMTLWRMQKLRRYGVGVMSIAHNEQKQYGDGTRGTGGLTSKGKDLLGWMNECKIIPDLSGVGYITAKEVLDFILSEKLLMKPMASHSGCYTQSFCYQDLTDYLLRRMSHIDGYVGIPYTHREEFMRHATHAFRMMLGGKKVGVCSSHGHRSHFEIATDLARENLSPHIFGQNFKEFLMRALPQT